MTQNKPNAPGPRYNGHRARRDVDGREAAHLDPKDSEDKEAPLFGEFPSNGLAGKIHSAQTVAERRGVAPDDLRVLRVAWVAHQQGRHAAEVWPEVADE